MNNIDIRSPVIPNNSNKESSICSSSLSSDISFSSCNSELSSVCSGSLDTYLDRVNPTNSVSTLSFSYQ